VSAGRRCKITVSDQSSLRVSHLPPKLTSCCKHPVIYEQVARGFQLRVIGAVVQLRQLERHSAYCFLPTIDHVVQIRSQDLLTIRNGLREHLFGIRSHPPAQIESWAAVSIRYLQRGPYPLPEFGGAFAAEVKIGKRPPRFKLTIHAGRIQQPSFRFQRISACFGC